MMTKQQLGNEIKKRRKFLQLTQEDLSEISEISLRCLLKIENGKGNPTFESFIKVSESLGFSINISVEPVV